MWTPDIAAKPGETSCVTLRCKKTAALLFDRIWDPGTTGPFKSFWSELDESASIGVPDEVRFYRSITALASIADATNLKGEREDFPRDVVHLVAKHTGCVAIYPDADRFTREFQKGDYGLIALAIQNLQIVDEDALDWERVLQFREDKESRKRYIRFHQWLNSEMLGKSEREIKDLVWLKLEDYHQALKKHGITTVLGELKRVLDPKVLLPTAGAGGAAAWVSDPLLGLLVASGITVANLGIRLYEHKLKYDDVRNGKHSEVAYLYEAKKLLKVGKK
jgi:hypothetical protein